MCPGYHDGAGGRNGGNMFLEKSPGYVIVGNRLRACFPIHVTGVTDVTRGFFLGNCRLLLLCLHL